MNDDTSELNLRHESWDTFWRASETAAYSAGGLHHPSIAGFWTHYFEKLQAIRDKPSIVDVASGSGAVIDRILAVFGDETASLTCVDVSKAAIDRLISKYPGVTGIVADVSKPAIESSQFDVATSQFGIEYAGNAAIAETCKMVADDGHIALLMHHNGSPIFGECSSNLAAIERARKSNFVRLAMEFLEQGFRAVDGADRAAYEAAGTALQPAVEDLDAVMAEYGKDAADGTIVKLYSDVNRIHTNMSAYDATEVRDWLMLTERELNAYAERMRSMRDSALSEDAFDQICKDVENNGFAIEISSALTVSVGQAPLAWVLVANRGRAVLKESTVRDDELREKIAEWQQRQIESAVRAVTDTKDLNSPILEARPAWTSPFFAVICQVREQGSENRFHWAIAGELPTDAISDDSAATARDAARHFALNWQLEAARNDNDSLADAAESLFEKIQDDSVWQ